MCNTECMHTYAHLCTCIHMVKAEQAPEMLTLWCQQEMPDTIFHHGNVAVQVNKAICLCISHGCGGAKLR